MNTKLVDNGLRKWMVIVVLTGTNGRWCTFYTLAEFLAGEMFHRVRYTACNVMIGISCGKRSAESVKGSKYTIMTPVAFSEGCGWRFFWDANYPEVF